MTKLRKNNYLLQEKIYSFIKKQIKATGVSPSLEEIRKAMKIKSIGTIERSLNQLDLRGLIVYSTSIHRGIKLVRDDFTEDDEQHSNILHRIDSINIEGTIAAGSPVEKFSASEQDLLDISSIRDGENVYALVVKGQSMVEDHICDGDYVIIRRQDIYRNGDIIVAVHLLNGPMGSATLKRFFLDREKKVVRLNPANSEFNPIIVPENEWDREWEIQGKLLAVLRPD